MNYKVNISHQHKFIWLCSPRTGSNSLGLFFSNNYKLIRETHKGIKRKYSFNTIIPEKYNNYILIASCRNPYSRLVSTFKLIVDLKRRPNPIFPDTALSYITQQNQLRYYNNKMNEIDYFIHLENLEQDILNLPFINAPIKINNINPSVYNIPWQQYYYNNPGADKIVYNQFKEDFNYFGYNKEIEWL